MIVSALLNPLRWAFPKYVGQSPADACAVGERENIINMLAVMRTSTSSMKALLRVFLNKYTMVALQGLSN
jgi:hypothetical protein